MKAMTPGVSRAARVRAYLSALVLTVGLGGVAVRAWALQIDDGQRYRALAERQHELRLEIPAPRGDVVDALGRPLAISADAESIWANPHEVHDVAATADRLAQLLGEDPRVLEAKLASDHKFVWIERHVAPEVAARVRAAKLAGIELAHEPRRWYPARELAGPVIGRSDIDGNGVDGIELAMNDMLAGRRGEGLALRDARGRTMLADGLATAEAGASVHLSLDRTIQEIAERAVADVVTAHQAKTGVAVVVEVGTGRVLAMASVPSYDPNAGEVRGARDRAVTDAYEAGSVMKVFSVASALEAGAVAPDTEFEIGEELVVGGRPIHDTHVDKYLTVGGIIKRSSNIGAAKIALRLGSAKLHDGLVRFGFGARTGIELPGEQTGMLRDGARWRDIDLAHIAFGYGLTATPVQIAAALAAIGDGGMYHPPRIVDEVDDADGTVLYRPDVPVHRVVSERTAQQMKTMLASVFDKKPFAGTAEDIDVEGFRCGGKTGTAHKYDPATHSYSDRYLASFAGLAPIDHPRIAVIVMIDEPQGQDYFGAKVAGPAFAVIASETLRYLGVPGAPPPERPQASGVRPQAKSGEPVPKAQSPKPEAQSPALPPPPGTVPDFTGLGVGKALDVAREKHLAVTIEGSGRVVRQQPAPGAPWNARITLHFSDER